MAHTACVSEGAHPKIRQKGVNASVGLPKSLIRPCTSTMRVGYLLLHRRWEVRVGTRCSISQPAAAVHSGAEVLQFSEHRLGRLVRNMQVAVGVRSHRPPRAAMMSFSTEYQVQIQRFQELPRLASIFSRVSASRKIEEKKKEAAIGARRVAESVEWALGIVHGTKHHHSLNHSLDGPSTAITSQRRRAKRPTKALYTPIYRDRQASRITCSAETTSSHHTLQPRRRPRPPRLGRTELVPAPLPGQGFAAAGNRPNPNKCHPTNARGGALRELRYLVQFLVRVLRGKASRLAVLKSQTSLFFFLPSIHEQLQYGVRRALD